MCISVIFSWGDLGSWAKTKRKNSRMQLPIHGCGIRMQSAEVTEYVSIDLLRDFARHNHGFTAINA